MDTAAFLHLLETQPTYDGQIAHVEHISSRQAVYAGLDEPLAGELQNCLDGNGLSSLYRHQAQAVNLARRGKNVIVATSSASGTAPNASAR